MWPAHAARLDRVARHLRAGEAGTPTSNRAAGSGGTPTRTSVKQAEATIYHTPEALEREDILDWGAVTAQFDRERFLREGYFALRSIFTPAATARLKRSCQAVQALNDEWVDHDWHEPGQWARANLRPPTAPPLSAEQREQARGGCQLLGRMLHDIIQTTAPLDPALPIVSPHLSTSSDRQGWDGPGWEKAKHNSRLRDRSSLRFPFQRGVFPEALPLACESSNRSASHLHHVAI